MCNQSCLSSIPTEYWRYAQYNRQSARHTHQMQHVWGKCVCCKSSSSVINPRRMRCRVMVVLLCVSMCVYVYVCVCYHEICYIPCLYRKLGVIGFCRVAFTENTSFKSFGVICKSPLLSSLPDKLPMDRRDSDDFFSMRRVCIVSDSTYNTIVLHCAADPLSPFIACMLSYQALFVSYMCLYSTYDIDQS